MAVVQIRTEFKKGASGKSAFNVFHYEDDSVAIGSLTKTDLDNILAEFEGEVYDPINLTMSNVWVGVAIYARELSGVIERQLQPSTGAGNRGANSMPRHDAMGYKLLRDTRTTRPGAKRFVGPDEQDFDAEGAALAGISAEITDVEVALSGNLSVTPDTWQPVIARIPDELNPNTWVLNKIVGAEFQGISTQRSRRI